MWKHLLCPHFVIPVLLLLLAPNSFFQICPGVQNLLSPRFSPPHTLPACLLGITAFRAFAHLATFLACLSLGLSQLLLSHLHMLLFSAVSFTWCLLPQTGHSLGQLLPSPPPLCLCIFLEMIIPNKLYIVLYYASAASHGAIAGLSQVSIKGYCICNHIKP